MKQEKYLETGLTSQEVSERIKQNQVNDFSDTYTKSTLDIFKDNLITPFNFIIAIIGLALALVGAFINMLFVFIIVANIAVGIIQEMIAKRLVERLSLLNIDRCKVIRDSQEMIIKSNEVVLNDLMIVEANSQIICDGVVLSGELEVNEALLTGEYDPILKQANAQVLSGSYVISGKAYVEVEQVGENNYANKISIEAKQHKKTFSVLMNSMDRILKMMTIILVPTGIVMFLRSLFLENGTLHDAVVTSSASILGMIPIGVVLLITASLATGVIKLSRMNVLVQELHALESLSRVDLLCLDKTGTLTQGKMKVVSVTLLNDNYTNKQIETIMKDIVGAAQENNATFKALEEYYEKITIDSFHKVSFSSQRKWSSVSFNSDETYYLGAPDILLPSLDLSQYLDSEQRVILLARATGINYEQEILADLHALALIHLDDPIREDVKETITYFKGQGVGLKIISGDSPKTVSKIAQKLSIEGYEHYLDLSSISDDDLCQCACDYTIFGRANPMQKKLLIKEFKKNYTVAMTGDGVNDVLALKEADCSIAIAQGSDAAKHVSQLVLVDSEFNDLPAVVNEGRRVVNNLTKVASVYFVRTIYSFLLTVLCIIIGVAYPFTPIQITLINFALVGIPTFAITFESNSEPISGNFIRDTLKRAIPNALAIIMMIILVRILLASDLIAVEARTTMMYYIVAAITFLTVYQVSQPLNKFRKGLLILSIITFFVLLIIFKDSIALVNLGMVEIISLLIILALGIYLVKPLEKICSNYLTKKIL